MVKYIEGSEIQEPSIPSKEWVCFIEISLNTLHNLPYLNLLFL